MALLLHKQLFDAIAQALSSHRRQLSSHFDQLATKKNADDESYFGKQRGLAERWTWVTCLMQLRLQELVKLRGRVAALEGESAGVHAERDQLDHETAELQQHVHHLELWQARSTSDELQREVVQLKQQVRELDCALSKANEHRMVTSQAEMRGHEEEVQ